MQREPTHDLQALFEAAVAGIDDADDIDTADESDVRGWDAISHLQRMVGREALDIAVAASRSADPTRKRVGAAVLGQLGHLAPGFRPVFREERFEALQGLLIAEMEGRADVRVLSGVCIALGHLHDMRAIERIVTLRTHPDASVRRAVVHGLSAYQDAVAIDGLIALTSDPDVEVRDWATFGLGQLIATDSPAIRAALHARLQDADAETRNEAITGLAARKDALVIPTLMRELGCQLASRLFEAAAELADPVLCNALCEAERRGLSFESDTQIIDLREEWERAMEACGCHRSR